MIRRSLVALLVAAVPAAAQEGVPQGPLRTIEVDRIVAVVGATPILFSEVLEQINVARARGLQVPPDSAGQLRLAREVLNQMVDEEVMIAVAKDYKIEVPDGDVSAQVERQIDAVRSRFPSEQEFLTALRREGFGTPEQWRRQAMDRAKREELIARARDSLKAKGRLAPANVTEQEVAAAFERARSELPRRPATVAFRQLVVTPRAREASRLAAQLRLDSMRIALERGADFDSMARAVSMDPVSAAQGGDLGWNRRGAMVPEFDRMMFALNVGRISPIVETSYGFHIIRVDRVRAAEVRARHILIRPEVDSTDVAQARARADTALALWREGVAFDSLVRRFHDSAEERTLPEGFPRDSLPAEYRVALRDVPVDGFTPVFALPIPSTRINKWAVAQVTAVKEAGDYTLEEYQERIRQQLREEKSLRRTLDTLRREYYVALRL